VPAAALVLFRRLSAHRLANKRWRQNEGEPEMSKLNEEKCEAEITALIEHFERRGVLALTDALTIVGAWLAIVAMEVPDSVASYTHERSF
jgi:hypothetical protein